MLQLRPRHVVNGWFIQLHHMSNWDVCRRGRIHVLGMSSGHLWSHARALVLGYRPLHAV